MKPDDLQALRSAWSPARISALRERLRMKQGEFGLALGYSHGARVSELESEDRERETPAQAALLLEYLDRFGPLALTAEGA